MEEINIKTKIIHKHKTASEWNNDVYIPEKGELIIYDPDSIFSYARYKFGDGTNKVKDLPFSTVTADWNQLIATEPDYIKNKPFGIMSGDFVEIIPEHILTTTIQTVNDTQLYGASFNMPSEGLPIDTLKTLFYEIRLDGETFYCQLKDLDGTLYIGNLRVVNLD